MICKTAVIVSCFDYYDIRHKYIERHLVQRGYEVTSISTDFDHIAKKKNVTRRMGLIQLPVKPYYRNLSFRRLMSHYQWAQKVYEQLCTIRPELVFATLPPNSLAKAIIKYSHANKKTVIFDLCDLWPETYPLAKSFFLKVPFHFWKRMRDKYLQYANMIITECDYYQTVIVHELANKKTKTLYPALEEIAAPPLHEWDGENVHLAYLGSINNIIDISMIATLIKGINLIRPVVLHIIGEGENKEELMRSAKASGAKVVDYGAVFDPQKKLRILRKCRFGLNVMRNTVKIALTLKSIDYFRAGLPIISNIPGDTRQMLDEYNIGFHIQENSIRDIAEKVAMGSEQEHRMRSKRVLSLFQAEFSPKAASKRLAEIFDNLV